MTQPLKRKVHSGQKTNDVHTRINIIINRIHILALLKTIAEVSSFLQNWKVPEMI